MSHVSISRSYAVLAGLEGYIKATSKVRSAAQAAKQEMDRLLHADKVQQEKEAKMGKSQSAKLERQLPGSCQGRAGEGWKEQKVH